MGADHFQRGLHSFRTGIAEETPLKARNLRETPGKTALIFVIVQVRTVEEQFRLPADRLQDARMRMTERVYANARDQVEIAIAIDIVHVTTFPPLEREGVTAVVLYKVVAFETGDFFEM